MSRERGRGKSRLISLIALAIGFSVVIGGCATGPSASTRDADVRESTANDTAGGEFELIAQGQNAAVRLPVQTVVTEQETWIDGWAALTANESPPPERPEVSFADSTVVIIVLGERPTGGYSVAISNVTYSGDEATVEVRVENPAADAMVTQALTTPFVVARLVGPNLNVIFTGDDVFEEFQL
ncbi:MAG: protease complex subunit PrcB family protein [Spirochaetales bacterium]